MIPFPRSLPQTLTNKTHSVFSDVKDEHHATVTLHFVDVDLDLPDAEDWSLQVDVVGRSNA
jgi:hypothetical protein